MVTPDLLQLLPIPTDIFTDISMDFIFELPQSQGKNVIYVVVDRLMKYAHFMALTHPYLVATDTQRFLDNIYCLHGLPQTLVSDSDPVFINTFWK